MTKALLDEPITDEMLAAGLSAWQSAIKDRNLDQWLAHMYTAMRSSAPQEPDDVDFQLAEQLRIIAAYTKVPLSESNRRVLESAAATIEALAIATRTKAQEPVVDDELVDEFLREIYGHAFREGAECTIQQWDAEISSGGPRPETPSMPHNDCESEGSYQFSEDVKPKLLALLNRLQAKAPETGEE